MSAALTFRIIVAGVLVAAASGMHSTVRTAQLQEAESATLLRLADSLSVEAGGHPCRRP